MSNLLSQASLVMIPSGYKEDTVYSPVPTNGNGDLSFTRASNGTRINSAGLVEVVAWNLLQQSETFDNAGWNKDLGASVTADTTTAPNGTTTADTLTISSGQYMYQGVSLVVAQSYTISVYLRVASGTKQFKFNTYGSGNDFTSSAYTATTEWQRFEYTFTTIASGTTNIYPVLVDGLTGGAFFIWGAQLNIGSIAKPYFPTTDRLNVPRLTYQNGGGGCPSLLLEKQSTNLLTYSEQFDNATWDKIASTITTNATTSPDGTQNADRLYETSTNGQHGFFKYVSPLSASTNYAVSCYVKKGNRSYCGLQFWYDINTGVIAFFNLDNGTLVYEFAEGSGYSISNSKIENVGNGWYRLSAIVQIGITEAYPGLVMASTQWSTGTGYDNLYTGDSSKYIDIWGYQLEQSSYPTSYIPTTSSSATRVADAIGNQTTSIAQAFTDNTKGTIFFDLKNIKFQGGPEARFRFGDSADSLRFAFFMDAVGLGVYGYQGGGYAVNVSTATNQKIAIRFDGTSLTGFSQGVKRNTVTAGTNYVIEQMVGNDTGNLCLEINEFVLFNSVLTDAECIALTTL